MPEPYVSPQHVPASPEAVTPKPPEAVVEKTTNWKGIVGIIVSLFGPGLVHQFALELGIADGASTLFAPYMLVAPVGVIAGLWMLRDIRRGIPTSRAFAIATMIVAAFSTVMYIALAAFANYLSDVGFG